MREHQIVITLKPEQFLQVQKLARNAGAKSMGLFVRQQLLAALGIEGKIAPEPEADIEPVLGELKRLHLELKEFVAETLSAYSVEFSLNAPTDAYPVETSEGLPFSAESPHVDQVLPVQEAAAQESSAPAPPPPFVSDELETTAEKTFAISPRLGPAQDEKPFKSSATFNIDSSTSLRRDPLHDLLDEETISAAKKELSDSLVDDDDAYDVPFSILARRQQLAAQLRAVDESNLEKDSNSTFIPAAEKPTGANAADKLDKTGLSEDRKKEEVSSQGSGEMPKTQTAQNSTGMFAGQIPLENLDEDSPFSGGPPPKKRQ
ncbi:MAG: hypothetical protein K2X27_20665 [Candidatus Obscuribacterales bacterium]|nr:hypothetical protein [Candidatus Obscuribacterales bacterium]